MTRNIPPNALGLILLTCVALSIPNSFAVGDIGLESIAPVSSRSAAGYVVSPYLRNVTASSAVLRWQSCSLQKARLSVAGKNYFCEKPVQHGEIKIYGLLPDTEYTYTLKLSNTPAVIGTIRTCSARNTETNK